MIPFSLHSFTISCTNLEETGVLIGPTATRRSLFLPITFTKDSTGSALYAESISLQIPFLFFRLVLIFLLLVNRHLSRGNFLFRICRHSKSQKLGKFFTFFFQFSLYSNHSFARGVNTEFTQISSNPFSSKFLGNSKSRSRTTEKSRQLDHPRLKMRQLILCKVVLLFVLDNQF